MERVSAAEEFGWAIFTLHGEAGCYGVAHWYSCCVGISAPGCGGVRDERRHGSTSEWLISSELWCPTSECTHPHTGIQQCCVSHIKIMINDCRQSVLFEMFRCEKCICEWGCLVDVVKARWKMQHIFIAFFLDVGARWGLGNTRKPFQIMWLNEETWDAGSLTPSSHLLWSMHDVEY